MENTTIFREEKDAKIKKEKVRQVSVFNIFKYQFKSILRHRSFFIVAVISVAVTFAISIALAFMSTDGLFIQIYNYFVLLNTFVVLITSVLLECGFYFQLKKDDKTINILVVQPLKRNRLFIVTFVTIFIENFIIFLINYLLILIIVFTIRFEFDSVVFRVTTTYFVYQILSALFLQSFVIFLIIIAGFNITIVLVTLISSFGFIAALPYQFLKIKEETKALQFSNGTILVSDVYHSFNIQEKIENNAIKYPNLSKYVNNYFINNQLTIDDFSTNEVIKIRTEMWEQLGLIIDSELNLKVDTTITYVDTNTYTGWSSGQNVTLDFNFSKRFLTVKELINNQNNSQLLKEFFGFSKQLLNEWGYDIYDDSITYEELYKNRMANYYNDLLFLDESKSTIKNNSITSQTNTKTLTQNFISALVSTSYNPALSRPGIIFDSLDSNKLVTQELTEGGVISPVMLMARLFETLLYRHTSNYVQVTTGTLTSTTQDSYWSNYLSTRNLFTNSFHINLLANFMLNYTYFAGESSDDIWFNLRSTDSINLDEQKNLFLPYKTYTFKLIDAGSGQQKLDPKSYNNFISPMYYVLVQTVIMLITASVSVKKFNRSDFN